MKENEVVAVADFSENFAIQRQEEAQTSYYNRNQATMHPIVCVYKVGQKLIRDSVIFISDDPKHDAAAVATFVKGLLTHLSFTNPAINHLTMFSDGASSQYKSRRPVQNIARKFENPAWSITWNYFGSHHGKGPSDGETGVVKTRVNSLVLTKQYVIDTAKDFYDVVAKELTILDGDFNRHVYYITKEEIDRERAVYEDREVDAAAGVRGWHQVSSLGIRTVSVALASCFCDGCCADGRCQRGMPAKLIKQIKIGGVCCILVILYAHSS